MYTEQYLSKTVNCNYYVLVKYTPYINELVLSKERRKSYNF